MKYTTVKSVKEIPLKEKSYELFNAPLFHGTREIMLKMNNDERKEYFDACHEIRLFAKNNILTIPDETIMEFQKQMRSLNKPYHVSVYMIESYGRACNFEYGDLYFTNNFETAMHFTTNIGGEQGNTSYIAGNLMRYANIDIPDNINEAIDIVNNFYELYKNDKKIMLVTSGIEFQDLSSEGGTPFLSMCLNEDEIKEDMDEIYESYQITNCFCLNKNYRVYNSEKYQIYVVEEENFDLLKDRFHNLSKKKYLDKALREISSNDFRYETNYEDERNIDGSFTLKIEKVDYSKSYFNSEVVDIKKVTFYQEFFEEENISLDKEANIDTNIILEEKIILRLAYYILKQFDK